MTPTTPMKRNISAALLLALLLTTEIATAQVCNLKVVTDANPDYYDMDSMIHSTTSKWKTPKDKVWMMYYWNHIARRQTTSAAQHGQSITDPIRQFNDYGYMICSTISGLNCSIWDAMGYEVKFWDIGGHTVSEVKYGGKWHMIDNSLSALYSHCEDPNTLASVEEIGKNGACALSGGRDEVGHIALYHCINATSPNGYLEGGDTSRSLKSMVTCFHAKNLMYRDYYHNYDRGHRYILNLRENESYTRYYARRDINSPNAIPQGPKLKSDPAYFISRRGVDLEGKNPRYRLRGNGEWTWTPSLGADEFKRSIVSEKNIIAMPTGGLGPKTQGSPAEVVFKVQSANVLTSQTIRLGLRKQTDADELTVAVSINNGLMWNEVFRAEGSGDRDETIKLIDEIKSAYEVLVKVSMKSAEAGTTALKSLTIDSITALNSKTQPRLNIGKNVVYVDTGDATDSIVLWPELRDERYKETIVEEKNMTSAKEHPNYRGVMHAKEDGKQAYVVYRIDAPTDITKVTYGGRFFNRTKGSRISFLHSLNNGKSWSEDYALTDVEMPWDVIKFVTVDGIPSGVKSVLFRYVIDGPKAGVGHSSIYSVRMEANHKPIAPGFKPTEVTFHWSDRQEDYSLVDRSHTQLVTQVPFKYEINVSGADHPVVNSLRVALKDADQEVSSGYSDGASGSGEKHIGRWVTYGKNLAAGQKYTLSHESETRWNAGDPNRTKLTDGRVGSPYSGGNSYADGPLWANGTNPTITLDLGEPMECATFGLNFHGYPGRDAIKREVEDTVNVLTSRDGKEYTSQGFLHTQLRWKDVPVNRMWTDEETFKSETFRLIPDQPITTRYVKFQVTNKRAFDVTEIEVLDAIEYVPYDVGISLPDEPVDQKSNATSVKPKYVALAAVPSRPMETPKRLVVPKRPIPSTSNRSKGNASMGGHLVEERPTLECLGVRWTIKGDANSNARVEVRYRERGTKQFNRGLDLVRTHSGWRPDKAPAAGEWLFAGSVFDLEEGTEYELLLSLIDPDGGNAQKIVRMSTRSEPTLDRPTRTLHVVPGDGGGQGALDDPLKGLVAADAIAKPGDLFLVHKGVYPALWTLRKSGSHRKPIVYRAAGDGEAVISGMQGETLTQSGIRLNGTRDIWIEGLSVRNTKFGLAGNGADRIVVRGCHFYDNDYGITAAKYSDETPQTDWLIADNRFEGQSTWPRSKGIEDTRGVQINGLGNIVCYNFIRGFADGVDTFQGDECSAIDIYGNEIDGMTDDGIETDYSQQNVRVFRNRMTNVYQGITMQPTFAGPVYIFRNVMYNVCVETFKMHEAPSGCLMFHNTSVKQGIPLIMNGTKPVTHFVSRNTIFIGTPGDWFCYENTAKLVDCDFDYDGFGAGEYSAFMKLNGTRYRTLDGMREKSGMYANIVMLDSKKVFEKGDIRPENYEVQHRISDNDVRLASDSKAIDAGVRLHNINDDFEGEGPDLGAYELGQSIPHYGPRTN